jgi:hypothetical protein
MKALVRVTWLAVLTFALTTIAFAARKNQGNFTLDNQARLGSTELHAGQYKAEWTPEHSGAVKVEIMQHGKTIATTEGKLKDLKRPSLDDAVVIAPAANNQKSIAEIDFSNHKQALVFSR